MSIKLDEPDLNICRICLKTSGIFQSIVDYLEEGGLQFSDIIALLVPIAIHENDGLPQKICKSCADHLILLNHLRDVCIKSDTWLREKLKNKFKQEIVSPVPPLIEDDPIIADDLKEFKCEQFDEVFVNEDHVEQTNDQANKSPMCFEEPHQNDDDIDSDDEPLIQSKNKSTQQWYTCGVCNKGFPNQHAAAGHSKVHSVKGEQIKCEVCHVHLASRKSLHRHRKIHLKSDPFKQYACKKCDGETFNNRKSYSAHMQIHKTYYESEEEPAHSDQDHNQNSDDDMTNTDRKSPKNTQPKRIFKCKDCFRVFSKRSFLASHARIHQEGFSKKEFICDICNQKFKGTLYLKRHWASHPEKRIHKCNLCDKTFISSGQLADHVNRHNDVRAHECETCKKKFYSIETLKSHSYIHKPNYNSPVNDSLCPHCGKVFANNTILRQHLTTHSDSKSFACEQCPSRFTSSRYLKKHIKTHDGTKPFVCKECDRAFVKRSALTKHKRIHTGEKPFACTTCDKRFSSSENLKRHIRIHTGEKPYKCNLCDDAFTQKGKLTVHMRKHVGGNLYECETCPEGFRLHRELKEHILEHFLEEKEKEDAGKTDEIKPSFYLAHSEIDQSKFVVKFEDKIC